MSGFDLVARFFERKYILSWFHKAIVMDKSQNLAVNSEDSWLTSSLDFRSNWREERKINHKRKQERKEIIHNYLTYLV